MREILFRGQQCADGLWVYGYFVPDIFKCATMIDNTGMDHEVTEETVGQYTGLTDKNGVMIFEGDIVKVECGKSFSFIGQIVYRQEMTGFEVFDEHTYESLWYESSKLEVVGNIHDNPELLNGCEE